jgi:acyl-CoA thioesterase-1
LNNQQSQLFSPKLIGLFCLLAAVAWFFWPRPETRWAVRHLDSVKSGPIVALGDSLTEGVAVAPTENFPYYLSEVWGEPVLNAGVSGHRTDEGLARLESDVLAHNPRLVLVALGGNDLRQNVPVDVAFRHLREVVQRIQDSGAVVALLGVDGGLFYGPEYDEAYNALAEEMGCILVSDILEDILGRRSLLLDQVHPNGAGYKVLASKVIREFNHFHEELGIPKAGPIE